MIRGVGVDLCGIRRMEEAISHPRFFARVFSESERAYINGKGAMAAQTAAGLFAAKEAFLKALGTGIDSLGLSGIGIVHDEKGAPGYALTGPALERLRAAGAQRAFLSVSHEGDTAAAFCVLEGD